MWVPTVCIDILTNKIRFPFFLRFVWRNNMDMRAFVCDFWPKTPWGPSDDLGRSFGIISSPKFQNPTMLVKHVHICCKNKPKKNMEIKLFGHPLNPRAHGTFPRSKSAKFPTRCTKRELRTTNWHPSYACFTFQVNRQKKHFSKHNGMMMKKSPLERRGQPSASVLVTKSIGSLPSNHFPSFRW